MGNHELSLAGGVRDGNYNPLSLIILLFQMMALEGRTSNLQNVSCVFLSCRGCRWKMYSLLARYDDNRGEDGGCLPVGAERWIVHGFEVPKLGVNQFSSLNEPLFVRLCIPS